MNIAVNTRLLVPKLEGIGWFEYETLRRIVAQHPEHTFYFIFDRDYEERFLFADNVKPVLTLQYPEGGWRTGDELHPQQREFATLL